MFTELASLIHKDFIEIFCPKKAILWNIVTSLATGSIIVLITESDTFEYFYSAQAVLFALSCALVILGTFASCHEICSDREIICREIKKGISPINITLSRCIKYAIISIIMSICICIPCIIGHIVTKTMYTEFFAVTFCGVYVSVLSGLLISVLSKKQYVASTVVPVFVLLQIVFSGRIFMFKNSLLKSLSYLSFTRWILDAYLRITNSNEIEYAINVYGTKVLTENVEIADIFNLNNFFMFMPLICITLFVSIAISIAGIND